MGWAPRSITSRLHVWTWDPWGTKQGIQSRLDRLAPGDPGSAGWGSMWDDHAALPATVIHQTRYRAGGGRRRRLVGLGDGGGVSCGQGENQQEGVHSIQDWLERLDHWLEGRLAADSAPAIATDSSAEGLVRDLFTLLYTQRVYNNICLMRHGPETGYTSSCCSIRKWECCAGDDFPSVWNSNDTFLLQGRAYQMMPIRIIE